MSLAELISQRRILVTMGPGGVGKTTVAAALGLQAAVEGKRALVLTLDPALRLANALGLSDVPAGERRELSVDLLQAAGVPAKVPLNVEMLDTQKAWAGAICREVAEPRQRERILAHPFFKRMSADLAGAHEYAAMEELYHLYLRGGFDLVVLDTPPTVHGVDIIEAPDRVLEVLEHDAYRWLMRPALLAGKLGLRILNFSGDYVVRTLSRFTGLAFLKELAGFVDLFSGLLEGFRQRAAAVKATLRSPVTAFVLITAADPSLTQESVYLYRRLQHRELTPQAVVANRVVFAPAPLPNEFDWRAVLLQAASSAGAAPADAAALVEAMEQAHAHLAGLARRSETQLTQMRENLFGTCSLNAVPLLESDVHDLAGLEQLRAALFEPAAGQAGGKQ